MPSEGFMTFRGAFLQSEQHRHLLGARAVLVGIKVMKKAIKIQKIEPKNCICWL